MSDQKSEEQLAKAIEMTTNVMSILDSWKLSGEEILKVLSLPENVKVRHLGQFRQNKPLPDTPLVVERIRHVLGIANALRTSYPTNPHMGTFWLNNKTRRFNNQKPIDLIATGELESIVDVRKHLDCAYDWFTDEN